MVYRTSPQLGPGIEDVIPEGEVWFDIPGRGTLISPRVGNPEFGSDGQVWVMVNQSGGYTYVPQAEANVPIDPEA